MAFKKGHQKYGGKKKGTPNGERRLAREIIENALQKSIPERLLELCIIYPDKEPDILQSLMPFCYPKLQTMQISAEPTPDGSSEVDGLVVWLRNTQTVE